MSTNADKQSKTEFNVNTHQQKDKAGDYQMQDAGQEKNKHEKTSITFERKKVDDKDSQNKDLNKDMNKDKDFHYEHNKDMNKDLNKDLNQDKDWNKDKDLNKDKNEGEGKGIINAIKEKVRDVLGSGDNDKNKDKDTHMSSGSDYNKNKEKDVHMGADYNKNKDLQHEKFGSSAVGVGSDKQFVASSGLDSDKQFASSTGGAGLSSGAAYSGVGQQTVDHKNLGAEHREVGYDRQPIIASKEKDKDAAHKIDVHGSLYTSGAGSTYKTNEAK